MIVLQCIRGQLDAGARVAFPAALSDLTCDYYVHEYRDLDPPTYAALPLRPCRAHAAV